LVRRHAVSKAPQRRKRPPAQICKAGTATDIGGGWKKIVPSDRSPTYFWKPRACRAQWEHPAKTENLDLLIHQIAAEGSRQELARLLLLGAGADTPDPYGRTPLMQSAAQGHADCMELLLRDRPDLDLEKRNMLGHTAFHLACKHGAVDVLNASSGCVGA
jgi:hypothetical protein